jgi:hypothetical protein
MTILVTRACDDVENTTTAATAAQASDLIDIPPAGSF